MNGVKLILRTLHHGERDLVDDLTALSERHRTEHEIHHVATDVAAWSREHVQRLADIAIHYDLDLDGPPDGSSHGLFATLRKKASERGGSHPEPGLLLLRDLREVHLAATYNSLHWEMLAQAAQALKDARLLTLASSCHPQTLRQMHWTNTLLKALSPQVLTSP
ncbi:hypothetical protein ACFUJU_12190 [Streptomyces sp. NPDC057235]|uniref:hypothetical protein n=1 Tax=Streptomyces sp. NPDC057235 TaxID=3346058 RepID=UPI00363697DF